MFLFFRTYDLYPSYASYRAHGLQLRCLSEETVPTGTPKWQPLPYTGGTAPGYRYRADGVQRGVGAGGYSWSSTVSGTNGMGLGFHVTWLGPSGSDYRAHGFQLRCLSEE
ncbi:hypothetical protein [uncultured Rikenella sp.]|uniref:hypothetical protein n=1 Tax=uncultured Rikenella sp. TaxID=368003 RepID=UPI0025E4EE99|nr:hypothetical protein [uncultured Rikenella sp.]